MNGAGRPQSQDVQLFEVPSRTRNMQAQSGPALARVNLCAMLHRHTRSVPPLWLWLGEFGSRKGNSMGDKGGKKDKEKNQQQLEKKQKERELKKQDKVPAKTAVVAQPGRP